MRKVLSSLLALTLCISVSAQNGADFISAVQAYSDEDFRKAEILFGILHLRDTTDAAVTHYLGLCEFATGKLQNAENHLLEAVRADSTNSWYLSSLASFYNSGQRRVETAEICEKLIKLKPRSFKNSYTLCLIGDVRLSQRRDSIALSCYEQALEMEPDYAPAQLGKAEALRLKGNIPAFFVTLDSFVNNPTVEGSMKSGYLEALMESIDSRFYWVWGDQISLLMDRCEEMHPDDVKSKLNKIQICAIKRDTVGMIDLCKEIIPLAQVQKDTANLVSAMAMIADFQYLQGKRKDAFKGYDAVLKIDPDNLPALNNYAYYLSEEKKQLKKALAMSRITIEAEPDNATYLDTYAWILHLLKRSAEAKPYLKHAMVYGGRDSAVILRHYAEVLETLGEKQLSEYYYGLARHKDR